MNEVEMQLEALQKVVRMLLIKRLIFMQALKLDILCIRVYQHHHRYKRFSMYKLLYSYNQDHKILILYH
jgi:hypothetical protein